MGNVAIDILVSGGLPPYSFAWSNNQVTEDISALSAGTYSIVVTDDNSCYSIKSFEIKSVDVNTDITSNLEFEKSKAMVYPNPVKHTLFINGEIEKPEIFIYTMEGSLVKKEANVYEVQVSDIKKGLYIVLLISNQDSYKTLISVL